MMTLIEQFAFLLENAIGRFDNTMDVRYMRKCDVPWTKLFYKIFNNFNIAMWRIMKISFSSLKLVYTTHSIVKIP